MDPEIQELFDDIADDAKRASAAFDITMPSEQLHAKLTEFTRSIIKTAGEIQSFLA